MNKATHVNSFKAHRLEDMMFACTAGCISELWQDLDNSNAQVVIEFLAHLLEMDKQDIITELKNTGIVE